jgi:hypothetical protein
MISSLTNALTEAVIRAHAKTGLIFTLDNPTPDFSGPGVSALQSIATGAIAIVLILALIGGLVAAGFIAVGHISSNGRIQKMGIVGLVSCIAGAAVAGSVAGLINWGQSLKVA